MSRVILELIVTLEGEKQEFDEIVSKMQEKGYSVREMSAEKAVFRAVLEKGVSA